MPRPCITFHNVRAGTQCTDVHISQTGAILGSRGTHLPLHYEHATSAYPLCNYREVEWLCHDYLRPLGTYTLQLSLTSNSNVMSNHVPEALLTGEAAMWRQYR